MGFKEPKIEVTKENINRFLATRQWAEILDRNNGCRGALTQNKLDELQNESLDFLEPIAGLPGKDDNGDILYLHVPFNMRRILC